MKLNLTNKIIQYIQRMAVQFKKQLILLMLVVLTSVGVWHFTSQSSSQIIQSLHSQRNLQVYATTTTRLNSLDVICNGNTRSTLLDSSDDSEYNQYQAHVNTYFKIDGKNLVKTLLSDQRQEAKSVASDNIPGIIFFIGPFLIGFIIIVLIWPWLCCCCCCPSCCPPKICQKSETQQYGKCQLYWPSIFLILAFLLGFASSITGITRADAVDTAVTKLGCAALITADDILNGNVTESGSSFFTGIQTIYNQLSTLQGLMTNINTNIADAQNTNPPPTAMYNAKQALSTAKTDVTKVPTGVANAHLTITYTLPVSGTGSYNSYFPDTVLGNSSSATTTIVGANLQLLNSMETLLDAIANNASSFASASGSFNTATVDSAKQQIDDLIKQVADYDTKITDYHNNYYTYVKAGSITIIAAVFSFVIIFSVLGLIATILMTFCDKYSCRYLLYCACCWLLIMGIISFAIATVLSIFSPIVVTSCSTIKNALSSTAEFNDLFTNGVPQQMRDYLVICLPAANDGNIIGKLAPNINTTLSTLSSTITQVSNFSSTITPYLNNISSFSTANADLINKYRISYYPDVSDTTFLAQLAKFTDNSYYTCIAPGDQWVPNIDNSYIPCTLSSKVTKTTCTSQANFDGNATGCVGCIDTYNVFVNTAPYTLAVKYAGCGAAPNFVTDVTAARTNYYTPKQTAMSNVATNYATVQTDYTTLTTNINTMITSFSTITTNLNTLSTTILDPTYGLIVGLNCQLFGQDFIRLIKVGCNQIFINVFFFRLVFGITAFAILFILCCSVCAGVRHFKHSERKDKILPGQFEALNQNSSADKFNDKIYQNEKTLNPIKGRKI